MYILNVLVPETHLELVKDAMFASGAGRIGYYSHCAWQTLGEGQFKSLPGSHGFLGELDVIEKVAEYKVEIVCEQQHIAATVAAMVAAHPYESPAYYVIKSEFW